ncbi:MAG: hypothetical protein AAFY34_14115 [Pseudomonadota bacterium]
MNTITKCLGASCLALSLVAPVSAGEVDEFEVGFTYSKYAAVDEIYEDFEGTARRACRAQYRGLQGVAKVQLEKQCRDQLLDRVVMKMNSPEIVALHEAETGRDMDTVNLAGRDTEPLSSVQRQ